jgi:zinc transport system substrate-binding protein
MLSGWSLFVVTAIALFQAGTASASLRLAASIHPVAAIVREIAGNSADITTIVPAGSDPHHFELTPRKARAIYEADAVFLIGGHFDGWVLPGGGKDLGDCLAVDFCEELSESLLAMGNTFNPHFWLDPLYAKRMGRIVGETLCSLDSTNCALYRSRIERFGATMDSISASISIRLKKSGFSDFVAFHPAWSYFARRYGLHEHGTIEVSHEQEPSARHVADLVRHMIASGVKVILVEEFSNPALAEGIAAETGARLVRLDPLGHADIPGRDTYAGLLNHNVSLLEKSVQRE